MKNYNWSEIKEPNSKTSYPHVTLDTPLGFVVIIDWKGWKNMKTYEITINGDWFGSEYDLEKAKMVAINHLKDKSKELLAFLNEK